METETVDVYPNPAKNVLIVKGLVQGARIEMRDQLGRESFVDSNVNGETISIVTESMSRGIYNITIRQRSKLTNTRVILH
jgi:hypothetical protein